MATNNDLLEVAGHSKAEDDAVAGPSHAPPTDQKEIDMSNY